jgi:hypothetical protein
LANLPWRSLLAGTIEPPYSQPHVKTRVQHAKLLLNALFGLPEKEWMKLLIENSSLTDQQLARLLSPPDLTTLLKLKDHFAIPDHAWSEFIEMTNLPGGGATLYQIQNLRKEWNKTLPMEPTTGKRGAEIGILALLEYLIRNYGKSLPEGKKLLIKFAFDGARVTASRKRNQEVGTLEILHSGLSISEAHSPNNAHQWIIYLGDEEYETLQEELARAIPVVQALTQEKKVG